MGIFSYCVGWQSFFVGIAASITASGLVAILLVKIFRVLEFELDLHYISGKMTENGYSSPVLDISILNKKWWVGFGKEEVNFGLFIPTDLVNNKDIFLITSRGNERWIVGVRGKEIFERDDIKYYLYRGVVGLAVHPDSRTHFLRLAGNFDGLTEAKIYYFLDTPYGRFPGFLRFEERIKNFRDGKLPYAHVNFN